MYDYRIIIIMKYIGGGVDYSSGPYTVQFDVGVTNVPLAVLINNDVILEDNETFIVNINEFSLPTSVTVGDYGQSTVTITANDRKLCKVTESDFCGLLKWDI